MARQLEDVVVNLSTADCITLDPAGRLVYTSQDINDSDGDGDTEEYLTSEVDSPLQNMAIYKEMILYGQLGGTSPIELPEPFSGYGFLDTAAKGLGAASDKGGLIDVDLVVYLNQIMGLSDLETPTVLDPKICIDVRQEVQGVVQLVEKCFLNYGAYDYQRSETYSSLPFPAYIPAEDPEEGWFEYLDLYTGATGPEGEPLFWIVEGPILPAAFPDELTADESDFLPGFEDGNIGGLAQAGDDARAVIEFMHSHPVLDGYATPLTCGAPHETAYDVSISPESGLQVPVMMVIGDEPREGTVTVANGGPDAASGTVTVTGMNPLGTRNLVAPMEFQFTNLASGASQTWTFPIELVVSWIPPRIFWEATVNAPYDVNSNNNTVEEVTTIIR
jgi:hypothetical protein